MTAYCEAPDCDRPAFRLGLCEAHCKRKQRGRSLSEPIAEPMSLKRRVIEASLRLADANTDEEYERAERALVAVAREYGLKESAIDAMLEKAKRDRGERIRQGQQRAKANGSRIGRPPKLTAEVLRRLLSVSGLSRVLGVDRKTVRRALRAHGEKVGLIPQGEK